MLKIHRASPDDEGAATVFRLAGRVAGLWVDELRRECNNLLSEGCGETSLLVLDLGDVSFVDDSGVALLGELAGPRVRLVNGSPFVREQLKKVIRKDNV
jgi:anti-anti-sigma regulatory factor